MRKVGALVALIFALLASACGGGSGGSSTDNGLSHDEAFISVVRDQLPTDDISDNDLVGLGHNICIALDSGKSTTSVAMVGVENGLSPYDAGFLVGASIAAYCPSHKNEVNG